MTVDGSGAAVNFDFAGPATVFRMIVIIRDNTGTFTENTFGAALALSNGILLQIVRPSGTTNLTPLAIKKNIHWAELAGVDVQTTNKGLPIRITFTKWGKPIHLPTSEDKLRLVVQDDLRVLDEFWAFPHYIEHD